MALANLRSVGQSCGSDNECNGFCRVGSCASGRCEKHRLAPSCACSPLIRLNVDAPPTTTLGCASYSFCNSSTSGICTISGLPTGASCKSNMECDSGSCSNGACASYQTVIGNPCQSFYYGSRSTYNFGCTTAGQVCVNVAGSGFQCGALINNAGQCSEDFDCESFACNRTVSPFVCVSRFSGKAGQPCQSNYACESHYCAPSGRCADPDKIHNQPVGAACPDGDFNCFPGLKCMGMNAPVCQRGTGASCEADSSVCPQYESPSKLPTQALFDASNQANLYCGCTGGGSYCLSRPNSPQTCDDEFADMAVFFKVTDSGSGSNPFFATNFETLFNQPWHLFPKFIREPMATYMCCALGPKGNFGVENLVNSDIGQSMAYYLDCNEIDMLPLPAEKMTTVCDPLKTLGLNDLFKGNVRWAALQH